MKEQHTFTQLKEILSSAGEGLQVKTNTPEVLYLNTNKQVQSKDFFFGAVYQKANHVSLHLFPLYTNPELKEELSVEVRKALQGKNCFNFKKQLSEAALTEIRNLTRKGYQKFVESGYIQV